MFEKARSTLVPPVHILAFIPAARYQLNGFFFWFVRLFVLNGISCEIKLAIIVVLLAFIVSSGKNDYKKLEWNSLIGVLRNVKLPFQCVLRHLNEIPMTSRP